MEVSPELSEKQLSRNYWLNVVSGGFSKLSDQLASPGLVLPWIMTTIGAPASLVGFLVPIRRAGALLPQLYLSGKVQALEKKKRVWSLGALIQALALALMAGIVLFLDGMKAGVGILISLVIFSLARSSGSLTFKDVLAKSVKKDRRGKLLAGRAVLGGLTSLGASLALRFLFPNVSVAWPFALLLGLAALFWLGAAYLFYEIKEVPGKTTSKQALLPQLKNGWQLLKTHSQFRWYVLARTAFIAIAISLPFYALFNKKVWGTGFQTLMLLVIVQGLSRIVFARFWGIMSDKSSRNVMATAGLMAMLAAVFVLLSKWLSVPWASQILAIGGLVFISAADNSEKISRDTYLINAAPNETRPLFTAVSNTVTGLLALAAGGVGFLLGLISLPILIVLLATVALAGSLISFKLDEAGRF